MLDNLYIKVTNKCNLNCPFCYINRSKINHLNTKEICRSIDLYPAVHIIFHGGEPTLYPKQLNEIIDKYSDKSFSITSNFMFTMNKEIEKLFSRVEANTSYSIDRFQTKEQEQKFLRNIRWYKENFENPLTLLVTLTERQLKQNPKELCTFILDEINPDFILFERLYDPSKDENFYKKTDLYLKECFQYIPYHKNLLYKRMQYSLLYNISVFPVNCSQVQKIINEDGSEQTCTNTLNIKQSFSSDCLTCKYYRYCQCDCQCFRYKDGFCRFPKNTFDFVKGTLDEEF